MKLITRNLLCLSLVVLLGGYTSAFAQKPQLPKAEDKSAIIAEIPISDEDALRWSNLRLQANAKRSEADKLNAEAALLDEIAASRLRQIAARLKVDLDKYEARIDQQTGKLYFALKKKE